MTKSSAEVSAGQARPGILLASKAADDLLQGLKQRFIVHDEIGPAAPTIRAIVGTGGSVIPASMINALPALELIALSGVGYDGVDVAAARARGVKIALTLDVLTDDVADLAIGLMLAVYRRIALYDRTMREGGWRVPLARRLSGRKIGIYGMGRIGQAIARRAEPFAGEILYTGRAAKPDLPWRFAPDLGALAEACDVLVVAAPSTPATHNAVSAEILRKLGRDGVLINIARGALVDEPALIEALRSGVISGAGLDVFVNEPLGESPLKQMDQVVLAPHQGSATVETRGEMAALVLANLDAHFSGRPLLTPLI